MSTSINSGDNIVNNNNNNNRRSFSSIPIRRITFRDNDSIANMTPPVNNTTSDNIAGRRTLHTSNVPSTLQHEIVWPSEPSLESSDLNHCEVPWMPFAIQETKAVAIWTILTLVLHLTVIRILQLSHDAVPRATSFWHALSLWHILRVTRSLVARLTVGFVSLIIRLDQVHPSTPGLLFAPANLLLALQTWKDTTYGGKGGILPNLSLRLCEWRMGRLGQREFWMILVVHAFVPFVLSGLLSCLVWLTTSIFSFFSAEPHGSSSSSSSTLVSLVLSGMSSNSSNSNAGAQGTTERIVLASALDAASQATMENNLNLPLASSNMSNNAATLIINASQCADAASTATDCLSSMTRSTNSNLMAAATASTGTMTSEANVSWMLLATLVTRHTLVTTLFTTGLLVVPVLLKVNALPEWLTFIILLPLYSIPVTRSGQGSTLNATATLWLLLTIATTTTSVVASTRASVSIGALLWQHLVPQLLGGWLAGRIMKVYFPDDPKT